MWTLNTKSLNECYMNLRNEENNIWEGCLIEPLFIVRASDVGNIFINTPFSHTKWTHLIQRRESGMHKGTVKCLLTIVWWVKCKARIYKYYTSEHCYCTQAEKSCSNPISGLRCANRAFCRESGIRSHLEHVLEIVSINTAAGLKL